MWRFINQRDSSERKYESRLSRRKHKVDIDYLIKESDTRQETKEWFYLCSWWELCVHVLLLLCTKLLECI